MKIKITTDLMSIDIEDNIVLNADGYIKRELTSLEIIIPIVIEQIINANIKLTKDEKECTKECM
jgi:hypothetical protein